MKNQCQENVPHWRVTLLSRWCCGMMSRIAARTDLVRVVKAHAVQHARAAVMAGGVEAFKTERGHDLDLVLRHGAERVAAMILPARRLLGIPVAPQVGGDHGELARQTRRDLVPGHVRERIAVHEQQRRSLPPYTVTMRAPQVLISVRVKPSNIDERLACARSSTDGPGLPHEGRQPPTSSRTPAAITSPRYRRPWRALRRWVPRGQSARRNLPAS